jgi:hypothetical protein
MEPADPYDTATSSNSELPNSKWRNMCDEMAVSTVPTVNKVTELRNVGALACKKKVHGKPDEERRTEKGRRVGTNLYAGSVGYQMRKN